MDNNLNIALITFLLTSILVGFITYAITQSDTEKNIKQYLCKHLYSQSVNYINCNSKLLNKVIEEVKYIDEEE